MQSMSATKKRKGAARGRSGCPVSCSLDLLGDRWSLLVVRDMLLGGKHHFRDFLASEERIATNILTDRLRRLRDAGILTKRPDPRSGRQAVYTLTEKGLALAPVLVELVFWGALYEEAPDADIEAIREMQRVPADKRRFIEAVVSKAQRTAESAAEP